MSSKKLFLLLLAMLLILFLLFLFTLKGRERDSMPKDQSSSGRSSSGLKPFSSFQDKSASTSPQARKDFVENKIPGDTLKALPKEAKEFPLAKQVSSPVTRNVAELVADNLKMEGLPTRLGDGSLSWVKENYQVLLDPQNVLWVHQIPPQYSLPAPTKEQAVTTAEKFLLAGNLLFPDLKIDTQNAKPVFVSPEEMTDSLGEGEAYNAYLVPISRATDLPVTSLAGTPPRYLLIDGNNQIMSVRFSYTPLDLQSVATVSLRSVEEVIKEIPAHRREIVLSREDDIVEDVVSLRLTTVSVAYLEEATGGADLRPYYLFSGQALMKNGQEVPFKLALSAGQ